MVSRLNSLPQLKAAASPRPAERPSRTAERSHGGILIYFILISSVLAGCAAAFQIHRVTAQLKAQESIRQNLEKELAALTTTHLTSLCNAVTDASFDPIEQHKRLGRAEAFSSRYDLSLTELSEVKLISLNSGKVPPDVSLRLIGSKSTDGIRDLLIQPTSNGKFIEGLTRANFACQLAESTLGVVTVSQESVSTRQLYIAVLHDKSGSTKGEAASASVASIRTFVKTMANPSRISIRSFSDVVKTLSPWTNDADLLMASVDSTEPNGGTALYDALNAAIDDLAARPGEREILALTDGKDSANTIAIGEIVKKAIAQRVHISFVGLKSDDLQSELLARVAKETGGRYFESPDSTSIGQHFARAAESLREPAYRLVALHPYDDDSPLSIALGNASLTVPK